MRIAICDDSEADLAKYGDKIRECAEAVGEPTEIIRYNKAQQILFAFSDAKDAADLVFLDISMPEMDGLTLAKRLRSAGYQKDIVFLADSPQYMLAAFDAGGFNYIVKDGTSRERFASVVQSAIASTRRKTGAFMLFSAGGENRIIPLREIQYFEVVDRIIQVHYASESFSFFSTIGKLEARLRGHGFVRIHRAILVAVSYIESFSYNRVQLRTGQTLPLSRGNYSALREAAETAELCSR